MKCTSIEISRYLYEVEFNGEVILYSPVLHSARQIDRSCTTADRNAIVSQFTSEIFARINNEEVNLLTGYNSPHDIERLTIILNFKCNFNCSYCYAAKGRSDYEMDVKTLDVTLDWFLNKNRIPEKDLYIHIVGGGEPIISWRLVEEIVKKVVKARTVRRRRINVAVTTNGSLITDDKASFLAASDILVNVSFDVIQEIHNLQRSMYDDVECGILSLQRTGARFAIRSTVTPLNVDRMAEMVENVLHKYPRARRLNLEAVMAGKDVFESAEALRIFLAKFRAGFDSAYRIGAQRGLNVVSAACSNFGCLKDRFCKGDFCITPYGDVVICHRISSPSDAHYPKLVFGYVEDGNLIISQHDYNKALAFSLDHRSRCRSCFLRWHCAGLCIAKQTAFPAEYYDVLCESACAEGFEHLKIIANNRFNNQGVPTHKQTPSELARSDKERIII